MRGRLDRGGEGGLPDPLPFSQMRGQPRGPGHVQRARGPGQPVRRLLLQAHRYDGSTDSDVHPTTRTLCHNLTHVCVCVCADVSCSCPAGYIGNGDYCNGVLTSVLATYSNFSIFYQVSVTPETFRSLWFYYNWGQCFQFSVIKTYTRVCS